jgi:hypothetical protein
MIALIRVSEYIVEDDRGEDLAASSSSETITVTITN